MNEQHSLLSAFITSTDVEGNVARINTDAICRIEGKCPADQYAENLNRGKDIVSIASREGENIHSWFGKETPEEVFNKIQNAQISRLESLKKINIALPSLTKSFNTLTLCTLEGAHEFYIQADAISRIDNEELPKKKSPAQCRIVTLDTSSYLCQETMSGIEKSIEQAQLRRIEALSKYNLLIR